uniref:DUF569 domain-containing protein n=1 Tax=Triticum urartu TaxID=4572 RepID=A0A8R7V5E1_TRIUA
MDQFHHSHHVRLRNPVRGAYLHADEDGHGVSLHHRRDSMNVAWAVHLVEDDDAHYLHLHSAAYGRYLASTTAPAPLGHRGLRIEQRNYNHTDETALVWLAVLSDSGDEVLLQHFNGRFLRANGRYLPWNDGASVDYISDIHRVSTMMHWAMEHVPAREAMPPLPPPTGLPFPAAMVPSRVITYAWRSYHGDLLASGTIMFRGRSVFHLREELAGQLGLGVGLLANLGADDIVMCLPTCEARLFPLVVDLPNSRQSLHVAIAITETPTHAALRYADVDAE